MAKTSIGEPIPVGDLSSRTDIELDTVKEETSTAAIDALRSDILSAEASSTVADAAPPVLSAAQSEASGWVGLVQMSWQMALMPAITWSSYLAASWKAWEHSLQPQWPTR